MDLLEVRRLPKRMKSRVRITPMLVKETSPTSNVYHVFFSSFPFDMSIGVRIGNFPTANRESFLLNKTVIVKKNSSPETCVFGHLILAMNPAQTRAVNSRCSICSNSAFRLEYQRNKTVSDGQLKFTDFVAVDDRQSHLPSSFIQFHSGFRYGGIKELGILFLFKMDLQSLTIRLEEMRIKRRDSEQWMHHMLLPHDLRQRVRRHDQYKRLDLA
ncbi:hypothetical protein Tco_1539883 [Tanacetum coccineum]